MTTIMDEQILHYFSTPTTIIMNDKLVQYLSILWEALAVTIPCLAVMIHQSAISLDVPVNLQSAITITLANHVLIDGQYVKAAHSLPAKVSWKEERESLSKSFMKLSWRRRLINMSLVLGFSAYAL